MIFPQYKGNFEFLPYYPTIGGKYIRDYVNKAIRNLLNANIDVHSRRIISEFPVDGVKFISKVQYYFADMTFADKSRHPGLFQQVAHKGGESAMNISRYSIIHVLFLFQWETFILRNR